MSEAIADIGGRLHFVILALDNEDRIQAKINHFDDRIRSYWSRELTVGVSARIYKRYRDNKEV